MATPESIKKAIKKHQAKLDTIQIHAPKGSKERWRAHAQAQGKSMTAYIIALIESDITKEEKKMIIKKGMEFIDDSGDYRVIRIEGKHFHDYAVSVWKPAYNEDDELLDDLVHDHDTIMTASEIRVLSGSKHINYEE